MFNQCLIIGILLLPNTDCLQQVEDDVRGCTTSTKYWMPSTSWRWRQRLYYFYQILIAFNKLKMTSEAVLLLPNTDCLQQVEDDVRGCTTSTKYWLPSTSWRWRQRLYYFYQILNAFNKLKMTSEAVLLLPNTDCLQQVEDDVRGCTTSTKYWLPSTSWRWRQRLYYYQILIAFNKLKMMSEAVLLLPNTDCLQQVEDYFRGCTTSTKYWMPSTSWRWRQRLFYFYQILIAFNKLKIMSEAVLLLPNTECLQQVEDYFRGCTTSTKYWMPSTSWRWRQRLYYLYQILIDFNKLKIMSEAVLLLPNTECLQQVEDYFRGCTTSTKYWLPSTSWRWRQRLYYFYQILIAFNKLKMTSEAVLPLPNTDWLQQVEDYFRGCTTSTKYWLPSTSWRLCQRLYYFYQILIAFNKLKIMSEVTHDNWKGLKLFTGSINYYFIEETVSLNVSKEWFITMSCDIYRHFQHYHDHKIFWGEKARPVIKNWQVKIAFILTAPSRNSCI